MSLHNRTAHTCRDSFLLVELIQLDKRETLLTSIIYIMLPETREHRINLSEFWGTMQFGESAVLTGGEGQLSRVSSSRGSLVLL